MPPNPASTDTAASDTGNVRVEVYLPADVLAEVDAHVERRALDGHTRRGPGARASRSAVVADLLRGAVLPELRAVQRGPVERWTVRQRKAPHWTAWVEQPAMPRGAAESRAALLRRTGWEVEIVPALDAAGGEE